MNGATALPANAFLKDREGRFHKWMKEVKRTSLGSGYVAFHASRDEVLALADSDLVNAFRRVVLDPMRGLVMLMSPSAGHDDVSGVIDDFVSSVTTLKKIKAKKLRATRWRLENEPKNTGNEADCSFYFGDKARGFAKASATSIEEGDTYSFRVPPDLVVEVGLTHISKEKYLSYQDKGVVEFWQLNARSLRQGHRIMTVTFLDLQTESKPIEIDTSLNLPGVTPDHVARFIREQSGKLPDHYEVIEAVRALLEDENSGMMVREEAEGYELAS
ncbi:MAG: Uma2 family endonuclease [Gammaproteobacteria bacterium]|nr:Uma2 family endonuclease [Gammaproteobacteria bacterium]